jgi:hypothetical protein
LLKHAPYAAEQEDHAPTQGTGLSRHLHQTSCGLDIIGRLPTTENGTKFIFVALDHYTKWIETRALKPKDMDSVAHSILLLEKLDTDERRLEALDLMFPGSVCKGEILEQVVGYMNGKSVGDPIEYLYKKGSESTELPQEMGMYLFEKGVVNMFLHWSRTEDVQSIKDISDE